MWITGIAALLLLRTALSLSCEVLGPDGSDGLSTRGDSFDAFRMAVKSYQAMRLSSPRCSSPESAVREARLVCDLARQTRGQLVDHTMILKFDSAETANQVVDAIWQECAPEVMLSSSHFSPLAFLSGIFPPRSKRITAAGPTVSILELESTQGCPACGVVEEAFTLLPLLVRRLCYSGQPAIASCSNLRVFIFRPADAVPKVVPRLLLSSLPHSTPYFITDIPLPPRRALHTMLEAAMNSGVITLQTLSPEEADGLIRRRQQLLEQRQQLMQSLLSLQALAAERELHRSALFQAPSLTTCPYVQHVAEYLGFLCKCLVSGNSSTSNATEQHETAPAAHGDVANRSEQVREKKMEEDNTPEVQTVDHFLFMVIDTYFVNMKVWRLGEPALVAGSGFDELSVEWKALMALCTLLSVVWVAAELHRWWNT